MDKLAVTVKNDSDDIVYIDHDPNWDDQVLTIDGKPQMEIYPLEPNGNSKVVVGVEGGGNEMGVIFATSKGYDSGDSGFFQLTIGPDGDGELGVTDGGAQGEPTINYTLHDRKPSSMTMLFVNDHTRSVVVTMKNESSYDIQIQGNDNWDDQVVTINGKPHKKPYVLQPGGSVAVGLVSDLNLIGLDIAMKDLSGDGEAGYYMEIGPNDAGVEDVTDSNTGGNPAVKYTLHDQKPLSVTVLFVDAG